MTALEFNLHAASVIAPGFATLDDLRSACRHDAAPTAQPTWKPPVATLLPANERRRVSTAVRFVLACIEQVLPHSPFPVDAMRSVFATDEGTGEVCVQMLDTLATTREISPLLFPNSVHNAPAGYFSMACRNRQPATVVSLGLESFASALLCAVSEALTMQTPVLLVSYDLALPAPMNELLPIHEASATAWVLSSGATHAGVAALGRFSLRLEPKNSPAQAWIAPSWLPSRWSAHSSARALAALGLLEAAPGTPYVMTLGAQQLVLERT